MSSHSFFPPTPSFTFLPLTQESSSPPLLISAPQPHLCSSLRCLQHLATTQSTDPTVSAENPILGPHHTSGKSTQLSLSLSKFTALYSLLLPFSFCFYFGVLFFFFYFVFFFLTFFSFHSVDVCTAAGTDTCWNAPTVHPSPLKLLLFFLLRGLEEEMKREEMVDLQRANWMIEGICGSGSGIVTDSVEMAS